MIEHLDFKNHVAITSCNDISEVCKPLYKLGIKIFIYVKVYKDGSRSILSNHAHWNTFYFDNFYKLKYPQNILFERLMQGNILLSRNLYPEVEVFGDAYEFFGFDNALALNKKHSSYKEIFYFCADINNAFINHYYINNIEVLDLFSCYFKDKAHSVIKLADRQRILTPKSYLKHFSKSKYYKLLLNYEDINNEIINALKFDKFYLPDHDEEVYLTKKQLECARWLIQGKSAEEIAIILNLSKRTVEEHITNMKLKLNCYKITQLVYKLSHYHYLFDN